MGKKKAPSLKKKKKKNKTESTAIRGKISSWIKGLALSFFGNKKKDDVVIPPIEAAPPAPEVQPKKKRRKKAPLTLKKKSKYPPIPKPKKRGRPKMLVRKPRAYPFDGGRAQRKIYAGGGEVLHGDERYCVRCCEQLHEDEGDKVHPWLDPNVCFVCREKGGDTDEEEWRLLNGGLFDE